MKLLFLLIILVIVVMFSVQNSTVVSLKFFSYAFDGSLAVIVLVSFSLGVLGGIVYMLPAILKKQMHIAKLQKNTPAAAPDKDGGAKKTES